MADRAQRSQFPHRFSEFARACLKFLEQTHVLDRDHGLVGESLKEPDLLAREGANLGAANCNDSNRNPFAKQRGTSMVRYTMLLGSCFQRNLVSTVRMS